MSAHSKIEWTESTWNPLRGCSRKSPGCFNCYAEGIAYRFSGPGQAYEGLAKLVNGKPTFTGKIRTVPELLDQPIRWSRGRRIFVNSTSDLFHENVPFQFIADVFAVMACTQRHTYQILTKRPERALEFFKWLDAQNDAQGLNEPSRGFWPEVVSPSKVYPEWKPWREGKRHGGYDNCGPGWPLTNVQIGVSVEDRERWLERISMLREITAAAVRFVSYEPALEHLGDDLDLSGIDWLICGGESGPHARPMHADWARSIRDQCHRAGVAFFFKQWGEWAPREAYNSEWMESDEIAGKWDGVSYRYGKKSAGRILDGRTWDEFPKVAT